MSLAILPAEFAARREGLAERLGELGLAGAVLFDPHHVLYYTGFAFIPTERPIAFALAADGRGGMLVPDCHASRCEPIRAAAEACGFRDVVGNVTGGSRKLSSTPQRGEVTQRWKLEPQQRLRRLGLGRGLRRRSA